MKPKIFKFKKKLKKIRLQATILTIILPNPLSVESWEELLNRIINYLIYLAIPVCSLAILYGGWKMISSEGNEEAISEGKKVLKWAIIGFIIIILAKGIALAIKEVLTG